MPEQRLTPRDAVQGHAAARPSATVIRLYSGGVMRRSFSTFILSRSNENFRDKTTLSSVGAGIARRRAARAF